MLKTGVLSLLGVFVGVANVFASSSFSISTEQPNASLVTVTGQVMSDVSWVWLHLESAGNPAEETFVFASRNTFTQKIYLRHGPGTYTLTAYTTTLAAQYGSAYNSQKVFTIQNTDQNEHDYLLPSAMVQSDDPNIVQLAQQITRGLVGDLAKSQAIHDWVATNIAYDTSSYFTGNVRDYSAVETLRGGVAECNGYARLNTALHRAAGIPAADITGIASNTSFTGNHMWNEVYLNDHWIFEDTTWDAGVVSATTHLFSFQLSEQYFNPTADAFAVDHTASAVESD